MLHCQAALNGSEDDKDGGIGRDSSVVKEETVPPEEEEDDWFDAEEDHYYNAYSTDVWNECKQPKEKLIKWHDCKQIPLPKKPAPYKKIEPTWKAYQFLL